eukprot:tig00000865_g5117.t1
MRFTFCSSGGPPLALAQTDFVQDARDAHARDLFDRVREKVDIARLVSSEGVALRRAGRSFIGLCPFHEDSRPSLSVTPEKQIFKCFACGAGGDVISFLSKRRGLSKMEAALALDELGRGGALAAPLDAAAAAAWASGAAVPSRRGRREGPAAPATEAEREAVQRLLCDAQSFFRRHFLEAPEAEAARAYVRGRGIGEVAAAEFGVGYAPDSYSATLDHLTRECGHAPEAVAAAGLAAEASRPGPPGASRFYDRFRGRLTVPIHGAGGVLVAFGGRLLREDGTRRGPKYLNSPATGLFDKSRTLFSLHRAAGPARARRRALLVEGYMDALFLHQAGLPNTVASMGTAVTLEQLAALAEAAGAAGEELEVLLCLDADAAGPPRRAACRGERRGRAALLAALEAAEEWAPWLWARTLEEQAGALRGAGPDPALAAALQEVLALEAARIILAAVGRGAGRVENARRLALLERFAADTAATAAPLLPHPPRPPSSQPPPPPPSAPSSPATGRPRAGPSSPSPRAPPPPPPRFASRPSASPADRPLVTLPAHAASPSSLAAPPNSSAGPSASPGPTLTPAPALSPTPEPPKGALGAPAAPPPPPPLTSAAFYLRGTGPAGEGEGGACSSLDEFLAAHPPAASARLAGGGGAAAAVREARGRFGRMADAEDAAPGPSPEAMRALAAELGLTGGRWTAFLLPTRPAPPAPPRPARPAPPPAAVTGAAGGGGRWGGAERVEFRLEVPAEEAEAQRALAALQAVPGLAGRLAFRPDLYHACRLRADNVWGLPATTLRG